MTDITQNKKEIIESLKKHLQIALEVELSTIPIYLYSYYSIIRQPQNTDGLTTKPAGQDLTLGNLIANFANKSGSTLMSVAVEEMLHLSLASNVLKALGGQPKIYGRSPATYPTNLNHHAAHFSVGLESYSYNQLSKFLTIELPAKADAPPEGDNWQTLGQFYEYIENLINQTEDSDYNQAGYQLGKDEYYNPNNVDTVYPKNAYYVKPGVDPINPHQPWEQGAQQAVYSNADDSGGIRAVTSKQAAINALHTIVDQGEGFKNEKDHQFDDKTKEEESHWYKYNELSTSYASLKSDYINYQKENPKLTASFESYITFAFPKNPSVNPSLDPTVNSAYAPEYLDYVYFANATYSYLLWMTEISYTLKDHAQSAMFSIGMHKAMIFVLDKVIGAMRYQTYTSPTDNQTYNLTPSFENYQFASIKTAKEELIALCKRVINNKAISPSAAIGDNILERIQDLPNVHVVNGFVSFS